MLICTVAHFPKRIPCFVLSQVEICMKVMHVEFKGKQQGQSTHADWSRTEKREPGVSPASPTHLYTSSPGEGSVPGRLGQTMLSKAGLYPSLGGLQVFSSQLGDTVPLGLSQDPHLMQHLFYSFLDIIFQDIFMTHTHFHVTLHCRNPLKLPLN